MPRTYYDALETQFLCCFCNFPTWEEFKVPDISVILNNTAWCCKEQQEDAIEQLQEQLKNFWVGRVTKLQSLPNSPTTISGDLR
jgi:hypothetical protein